MFRWGALGMTAPDRIAATRAQGIVAHQAGQPRSAPAGLTAYEAVVWLSGWDAAALVPATRPADYEEAMASHRALVRRLDVALNGEAGAAKQASLCDVVGQFEAYLRDRARP